MKKILVGCNVLTSIDSIAYPSHCQNWFNWGRYLRDYDFFFNAPRRTSIDNMRNMSAKIAMEQECEYLFFYDDDCFFPTDTLQRLIAHNKEIVAGLTFIRAYPFEPMVFSYLGEKNNGNAILDYDTKVIGKTELYPCNAVGFSCVLIKTSILLKMKPPFFVTGAGTTEDVYFCIRAQKELGISIYCDPTVEVTHIVDRYAVKTTNRDRILKFEKDVHFKGKEIDLSARGKEYIEYCQDRLTAKVEG